MANSLHPCPAVGCNGGRVVYSLALGPWNCRFCGGSGRVFRRLLLEHAAALRHQRDRHRRHVALGGSGLFPYFDVPETSYRVQCDLLLSSLAVSLEVR